MRRLLVWFGLVAACMSPFAGESLGDTSLEPCRVTPHLLVRQDGQLFHSAVAEVRHSGAPVDLRIQVQNRPPLDQAIDTDTTEVEFLLPASNRETRLGVTFSTRSGTVAEQTIALAPARKLEIYLLPHSHVDIGYTKLQTKVERDHWNFLQKAIDTAQQTDARPVEAQFKWNVEVLWAVDSYLRQASEQERAAFVNTVRRGQIGLDAFYCNELAGLCRPEELMRLLECARRMRRELGVPIESAMVTDCPGLTWGAVPALAQSGVKYLSLGPNSGHRIGHAREAWDNRPFWWVSPCGKHRVLCWQTDNAYHPAFSNEAELRAFLETFDKHKERYPYDVLYYRQCKGDNEGPDVALSAFVEGWNARFAYPHLIIATTTEAFRAFEERYGNEIPSAKGDFSPYWEDGAASSARETALNRAAAERLVQAETLWAMLSPGVFPTADFDEAWRNVLLYDEHTWGARSYVDWNDSYPPGTPEYDAQWAIKQAFALEADAQSRLLLERVLEPSTLSATPITAVDVLNTSSWPRSDLVVLPKPWRFRGELVRDSEGNQLPAQRLSSGELAVLVKGVPAFGAARLIFHEGESNPAGRAIAQGTTLSNGLIRVALDEDTGAIRHLWWKTLGVEFVDSRTSYLNSYHYVPGFDPKDALTNGRPTITVKESGPLVAAVLVESDAPGCNKLSRKFRVVDGLNRVDIVNLVDKKAIPLADLLKKQPQKEGFYFEFAFDVPQGEMRIDMPWAVVRPEADQLPGACKNWFSVQRWVDVSSKELGITWATVDAPIMEVGAISPQPANPAGRGMWRKHIVPSGRLHSYVMNNYWTTNYRHDQPGPVTFRYSIAPHGRFDAGAAARFGTERSQPLHIVPTDESAPALSPLLEVAPAGVVVTALKSLAEDGSLMVRLFGASGRIEQAALRWEDGVPAQIWKSDPDGVAMERIAQPIEVLPFEVLTLRIERDTR